MKKIMAWRLKIQTLYMLDICAVSATKLTSAFLGKDIRKSKFVDNLRKLDKPNNCFSYLLAFMEKVSDPREIDTGEKLENKILSDLASMRSFFKEARIYESDEFFIEYFNCLRGNPIEEKRSDYLKFLKILNDQFNLGNPISPKRRLEIAKKIIGEAGHLDFSSRQHPIVLIGLACLYGNSAAKKLMKFKSDYQKFNAENVLADIMLISRFASIKLQIEEMGRNGSGQYHIVDFITDDDGLSGVLKYFTPIFVSHIDNQDGRETKIEMETKLKELLTDIEIEEYDHLLDLLDRV